jgi:hypothetical protein
LAWLRPVSYSWSDGTSSPSRALRSAALPLGYCSQPAAQAGHSVVAGLFAALGAIAVGGTARARMSILTEPALRPVLRSAQPRGRLGRRPRAALRGLSSVGWISADVGSSNMTATSRSCPRLRLSRGISSADHDPVAWRALVGLGLRSDKWPPFCPPAFLFLRWECRLLV